MKKNRFFLFFLFLTSVMFLFSGLYIQTNHFNNIIKKIFAKSVPADLGLSGDFQDIRVNVFPPGIEIRSGNLKLEENNFLDLPSGSQVSADSIIFQFQMFQMFTGKVLVDKVIIYKGKVLLDIDFEYFKKNNKAKEQAPLLSWEQLLNIKINSIVLIDSFFSGKFHNPEAKFEFYSNNVVLTKGNTSAKLYSLVGDLRGISSETPQKWHLPQKIDSLVLDIALGDKGITLNNLQYENNSIKLSVVGEVIGDLLRQSDFKYNLKYSGSGDVFDIVKIHNLLKEFDVLSGEIEVKGSVQGGTLDVKKNLTGKIFIIARNLKYEKWHAEKIEGSFDIKSLENIRVEKLDVYSPAVEREGNYQPGSGGLIEVAPFEFNPYSNAAFEMNLALKDAHIHWLVAGAVEKVYLLDHRVSGSVKLEFQSLQDKDRFSLKAIPDIVVPSFVLDNLRMNKNRKRRKIIDLHNIKLSGEVLIDKNKADLKNINVSINESLMTVQGAVDFKKGLQLSAEGEIDLKDVQQISEIDISGSGKLKFLGEGPLDAVKLHFDLDGKDIEYLNLKFGNVQGRITWDDKPDELLFTGMKASKNTTQYSANGLLKLGSKDEVEIDFQIPSANIYDLTHVFSSLVENLWWFPSALTGECKGTVKIRGGLDLDQLEISSQLTGSGWDYMKERFTRVSLEGGFDKGKYYLSKIDLLKYRGKISGQLSYSEKMGIDWKLESSFISLTDIDFFASLDVPMRGALSFTSQGRGLFDRLESQSKFDLSNFVIRGRSYGNSKLDVKVMNGFLDLSGSAHSGRGSIFLTQGLKDGMNSKLDLTLDGFDFSPLMLVVNPKLITDPALSATVSSSVKLRYRSGFFNELDGNVSIGNFEISKSGLSYKLYQPVNYSISRGSHEKVAFDILGREKRTKLFLSSNKSQMSGLIKGEADLGFLEFILPPVELSQGNLYLDMVVEGKLNEPKVSGRGRISDAIIKIRDFENNIENINGFFKYQERKLKFSQVEGVLGGGKISGEGDVNFLNAGLPGLDLKGKISNSQLKFYPFSSIKLKGDLQVVGSAPPYLVSGDVFIEDALIREKISGLKSDAGLRVARFSPPATSQDAGYSPFKLDVKAVANKSVWIKNELFDAEAKGNLNIVNTLSVPRFLGRMDIVQGKLLFKDYDFRIESGSLEFDNATIIDPLFNLSTNSTIKNYNIKLFANGRPSRWNIELSSNPSLQESEILSLLALGFTSDDLQRVSSIDRDVLQQGSAAALLLHSLEFNQEVRAKTGLDIKLDESVNLQKRTSVFRTRSQVGADASSEAAPKVSVSKRVGKKLDISLGSTIGAGTRSEQEVNASYSITPGLKIIGVLNNSSEGAKTQDTQTSYGMDIKVQKRFK